MNLLTQHIVWKFKSIIPYGSMLLAATALVHGWAGDALSPSMEKVASKAPTETVLSQFSCRGTTKRPGVSSPLLENISRTR